MRLLLAEDEHSLGEWLSKALSQIGCKVEWVEPGARLPSAKRAAGLTPQGVCASAPPPTRLRRWWRVRGERQCRRAARRALRGSNRPPGPQRRAEQAGAGTAGQGAIWRGPDRVCGRRGDAHGGAGRGRGAVGVGSGT